MDAQKQNSSLKSTTSPEASTPSQNVKDDGFKPNTPLTPSEIESLRKHKKQVLKSLDGAFDHLFKK